MAVLVLLGAPLLAAANPPDPTWGPVGFSDGADADDLVTLVLDGVAVVVAPQPGVKVSRPSTPCRCATIRPRTVAAVFAAFRIDPTSGPFRPDVSRERP